MSKRVKIVIGVALGLAVLMGILGAVFGSTGQNNSFQPQDEFKLTPWVSIQIGSLDLSITRAVFYLALAALLTIGVMTYIAKRMADRPNNVQTAVEYTYDYSNNNITRNNMDPAMAAKWFPFIATLFFFIWISNLLGYLPLPTNTNEKFSVFGAHIPSFAIYAATANISVTIVLALAVWIMYHAEGIRVHGVRGYLGTWVPSGVDGPARIPIFMIEVISHFVRIISLSVRLFANMLAGHLLILFMGGGLVVLLGLAALGVLTLPIAVVFFIFEMTLIATLQAFIFATLSAIYIGGATAAAEH